MSCTRYRILIVRLGNYCRSPLAEVVIAAKGGPSVEVRSAGLIGKWVGRTAHPQMIKAAAGLGYDLAQHQPTKVTTGMITWADTVLAMDHSILEQLRTLARPGDETKLHLYLDGKDVPDPMGKPQDAFDACAVLIEAHADTHLP